MKRLDGLTEKTKATRSERDQALLDLVEDGYTIGRIARVVGLGRQTVREAVKAAQLARKNEPVTDEE